MARGGEREAGLRARIEALLATLEKLGRCDLLHVLHVLGYILFNWTSNYDILASFEHRLVGTLSCDSNSQAT